jgi:hypothetical protein
MAPRGISATLRGDHRHDGGGSRALRHGAEGARSSTGRQPRRFFQRGHPFGTAREIEIGMGLARAHRVSYVGELGWELYVSTDQAAHVFETLTEAGAITG